MKCHVPYGVPDVVQLSATDGVLNGFDVVGILNVLEPCFGH